MTGGTLRAVSSTTLRAALSARVRANPQSVTSQATLAYGTGSGAFDTAISRDRVLAPGAADTLDLYTGTQLLDLFDAAAPLRLVKFIEIGIVGGGDTSGLRIGGASSNCWAGFFADTSDKHLVFPDGPSYRGGSPAGVAVTPAACNLKVENLGSVDVTYAIVIGGSVAVGGVVMGVLGLTYP